MADEELELDVNQPKGNKVTMILLIVLIVLVLIIGGVGAWLFLGKDSGSDGGNSSASGAKTENIKAPLHYLSMVPEFVVNFGPGSKVKYLQVDLQVATRDEKALAAVNTYRPVLRNDILVLLSGLTYEELKERGGKEILQNKLLNIVNKVVNEAMHGSKEQQEQKDAAADTTQLVTSDAKVEGPIENVYFTSFIMQ